MYCGDVVLMLWLGSGTTGLGLGKEILVKVDTNLAGNCAWRYAVMPRSQMLKHFSKRGLELRSLAWQPTRLELHI